MLDLKAELDATSRLTTLQPEMSTLSDTGDQPQAESKCQLKYVVDKVFQSQSTLTIKMLDATIASFYPFY